MKLLSEYNLGKLSLKNRLVMAPMCMFKVEKHDGIPTEFHRLHYGARAVGDVGLMIVEATAVSPEGRITDADLGLYNDQQIDGFLPIVADAHAAGAKIAVQLNHAGRKSECTDGIEKIYAPSALAFSPEQRVPAALSKEEIQRVIDDFQKTAKRAERCGFDGIELHAAHGFLINQFLSAETNKREDEYADPQVFISAVVKAVRSAFKGEVWLRVSPRDYKDGSVQDIIPILRGLSSEIACVHVSSGGLLPLKPPHIFPGYQIEDASAIRQATALPVIGVGLLEDFALADYVLETGQIDLVALGRGLLRNPYWLFEYAQAHQKNELVEVAYQGAYLR